MSVLHVKKVDHHCFVRMLLEQTVNQSIQFLTPVMVFRIRGVNNFSMNELR